MWRPPRHKSSRARALCQALFRPIPLPQWHGGRCVGGFLVAPPFATPRAAVRPGHRGRRLGAGAAPGAKRGAPRPRTWARNPNQQRSAKKQPRKQIRKKQYNCAAGGGETGSCDFMFAMRGNSRDLTAPRPRIHRPTPASTHGRRCCSRSPGPRTQGKESQTACAENGPAFGRIGAFPGGLWRGQGSRLRLWRTSFYFGLFGM